MTDTLRPHVFDQLPKDFRPWLGIGGGLPSYMDCKCGKRWHSDQSKPKGECTQATEIKVLP